MSTDYNRENCPHCRAKKTENKPLKTYYYHCSHCQEYFYGTESPKCPFCGETVEVTLIKEGKRADYFSIMVLITKKTFYGMGQLTEILKDHYFDTGLSKEEVVGKVFNSLKKEYKDNVNNGVTYSFNIDVLKCPNPN
jgi:hypothetical protein